MNYLKSLGSIPDINEYGNDAERVGISEVAIPINRGNEVAHSEPTV